MKRLLNLFRFGLVLVGAAALIGCAGAAGSNGSGNSGSGSGTSSTNGGTGQDQGTPPVTEQPTANYFKASNTHAGDNFGSAVGISADGNTMVVAAPNESSAASGINGNQSDTSMSQSGAVYVFTKAGSTWSQQAYIKASNPEGSDHFGTSLWISSDGNTLAVGSPGENSSTNGINSTPNGSATHAGAAYVFVRNNGAWAQQAYVKASNPGVDDEFGAALALSADGNTLAVAARLEDSNATGVNGNQADNSAADSGAAYIFTRSGTVWTQQAYLKASNTKSNYWFGSAIGISGDGNTLAVGSRQEASGATGINGNQSDTSTANAGAVYVFTRNSATWTQQAYVKESNTKAGNFFGNWVGLSNDGNTLGIDSCCEDSGSTGVNGDQTNVKQPGSGALYVFSRTANIWSQQAYIKATNTHTGDEFGSPFAISADGNTLVCGDAFEDSAPDKPASDLSLSNSGAAFVLTRAGTTWTFQKFLKAANADAEDQFSKSVAFASSAGTIVVAAPFEDSNAIGISGNQKDNSSKESGAVYIF